MSDAPLNLPERQLANELAFLVADKMWRDLGEGVTDGQVHNLGQSNYEAGCRALNLVGVYRQGAHYTVHSAIVPTNRVRRHMSHLDAVSRNAFDALLSAFIENYVSYEGTLSGSRQKFTVAQELVSALNLLVANGFAQSHEDGFVWTDKIGSIMKKWCIWDEDGNPVR